MPGQRPLDEAAQPQSTITGVLDWQTARVDHPFVDFDLGEWGTAIWRAHRDRFPELRRRAWRGYRSVRGLPGEADLVFEWFHACVLARKVLGLDSFPVEHPTDLVGSAAEARAGVRASLAALADAL